MCAPHDGLFHFLCSNSDLETRDRLNKGEQVHKSCKAQENTLYGIDVYTPNLVASHFPWKTAIDSGMCRQKDRPVEEEGAFANGNTIKQHKSVESCTVLLKPHFKEATQIISERKILFFLFELCYMLPSVSTWRLCITKPFSNGFSFPSLAILYGCWRCTHKFHHRCHHQATLV